MEVDNGFGEDGTTACFDVEMGEEMVDDKLFLNNLCPLIGYVTYENKT